MALSEYTRGQLIGHLLRTSTYSKPAAVYVALFKGDGNEMSGGGYARVQHGPGDAYWRDQTAGNGQSTNIGAITFPTPETTNWGVATAVRLFDASTGGNEIGAGVLSSPKTINVGDPAPTFPDGALLVSVT